MLTQARLKELLRYEVRTGAFYWRVQQGTRVDLVGKRAGSLTSKGYWCIGVDYKRYQGHRLAWLYVYGYMPKELDHKNGRRSCCRIKNLREANGQNQFNRGRQRNNSSGFKGVFANGKKWMARIRCKGKAIYLGQFDTQQAAYAAYCRAAKKLHGEFFNPGKD